MRRKKFNNKIEDVNISEKEWEKGINSIDNLKESISNSVDLLSFSCELDYGGCSIKEHLDKYCYFCNYSKTIVRHHIVPFFRKGLHEKDNLLTLCPNCHALIHKEEYFLQFSNGFFILVNGKNEKDKILPHKKQCFFKRNLPVKSLNNSLLHKKSYIE